MRASSRSAIKTACCICIGLVVPLQSAIAAPMAPWEVPGKEYSTVIDTDNSGASSPGQTLHWIGGGVTNGIKYPQNAQVDAMANRADAFFTEVSLDQIPVHLLFNVGNEAVIRWEAPKVAQIGIWGTPPTSAAAGGTDALEVWGGDGAGVSLNGNSNSASPDANRYSLYGDSDGTSVFNADGTAWLTQSQIGAAIGADQQFWTKIDVDGLMVGGNDAFVMFSIAPLAAFDGGEIWVWDLTKANASFLIHGGHTWDTAFDVMGTYGLASENVTVLEAVPVPEADSYALMLAGLGLMGWLLRRRG
jgi:hypothetical protein